MDELVTLMKAQLAVQLQLLQDEEAREKPEVVLARAGLSYSDIAQILGKKATAISKAVSRAKGSS